MSILGFIDNYLALILILVAMTILTKRGQTPLSDKRVRARCHTGLNILIYPSDIIDVV